MLDFNAVNTAIDNLNAQLQQSHDSFITLQQVETVGGIPNKSKMLLLLFTQLKRVQCAHVAGQTVYNVL